MLYNIIKEGEEKKGFHMCKYCNFKMNTRWGENIDCTDYDNTDAKIGLYIHYAGSKKAYYLIGEYYYGFKGFNKLGLSHEIQYCPFCGRKL